MMVSCEIEVDGRCEIEAKVNDHIGRRLRRRRMLLGMTQTNVGAASGVQFQQIQKYECGSTRISASRLHTLAQVLRAPIQYFYQGAPTIDGGPIGEAENAPDPWENRDALELMEIFRKLPERVRVKLKDFAKVLSESSVATPLSEA